MKSRIKETFWFCVGILLFIISLFQKEEGAEE